MLRRDPLTPANPRVNADDDRINSSPAGMFTKHAGDPHPILQLLFTEPGWAHCLACGATVPLDRREKGGEE